MSVIYDPQKHTSKDLIRMRRAGTAVLCPTCDSELSIELDKAEARRKGVPVGVHCPKDEQHVVHHIYLAEDARGFWKLLDELQNEPNDKHNRRIERVMAAMEADAKGEPPVRCEVCNEPIRVIRWPDGKLRRTECECGRYSSDFRS